MGAPVRPASNSTTQKTIMPAIGLSPFLMQPLDIMLDHYLMQTPTAENQGNGAQRSDDF
jgi:hypothetical protein